MGSLSKLFQSDESVVKVARVVGMRKTGGTVVKLDNVNYTVGTALTEPVQIGDTVLLNRSSNGKFYIVGKTEGLRNQNIEEVFRDG